MHVAFALSLFAATLPFRAEAQVKSPFVPKAVVLTELTTGEERAHAAWSLRAALNVAALQCQYSPYLATVRNYNDVLRHHGDELGQTLKIMMSHFRRLRGASLAQRSFDQYTTRTYNSFSTLEAQRAFCNTAGEVGRSLLATRKGSYADIAPAQLASIRDALTHKATSDPIRHIDRRLTPTPTLAMLCSGLSKKDRERRCR